jgi:hypothetical protein
VTAVLVAIYWVLAGAVFLSVPAALYVLGCCAVDAFAYDPWLDGPRDALPGRRPILRPR